MGLWHVSKNGQVLGTFKSYTQARVYVQTVFGFDWSGCSLYFAWKEVVA